MTIDGAGFVPAVIASIALLASGSATRAAEGSHASILSLQGARVWRDVLDVAKTLPRLDTVATSLELVPNEPVGVSVRGTQPGRLLWLGVDSRGEPHHLLPRALPYAAGLWWRSASKRDDPQALMMPAPGRHLLLAIVMPTLDDGAPSRGRTTVTGGELDASPEQLLERVFAEARQSIQIQPSEWMHVGLELLRVCEAQKPCTKPNRTHSASEELQLLLEPPGTLPPGIFRDPERPTGLPSRSLPASSLDLVKRAEGWRASLYEDPAGHCTIGHGHLVNLGPCGPDAREKFPGPLTPEAGEALLRDDLRVAQLAVERLIDVRLEQSQYAALVSFVFNVGASRFARSHIRAAINRGEPDVARGALLTWTAARGVELEGLKRRREQEAELFGQHRWELSRLERQRIEIRGLALRRVGSDFDAIVDIEVGD